MKKFDTPWSVGSLFICEKCGASFEQAKMADKLKQELRSHLKEKDEHKKIRVMVTGCLNVCIKEEQAVMYQPNFGKTEIFTVGNDFKSNASKLKQILAAKLKE